MDTPHDTQAYRVSYTLDRGRGVVSLIENERHLIPVTADKIDTDAVARLIACERCCSSSKIRIIRLETSG